MALVLLRRWTVIAMRRLSILAIVLTFGLGPNAASLCHAWCVDDNRTPECHETLASVVAANCCNSPAPALTAVFGTESRQEIVAPSQHVAVRRQLVEAPVATLVRLLHQREPLGLYADSPITILRI